MPDYLTTGLLDGRGFFPESWQSGMPGVLLLFVVGPLGSGIPLGVIMARDLGLSPIVTALLYLVSDVIMALIVEPELALFRWLGRRNSVAGRVGERLVALTRKVGLQGGGARGPLGLILLSFTIEPITSRVAGRAAGHGFLVGWSLAIAGDLAYFGLIMASTLWVSSVFGDDRLTIGVVLLAMWLLPMLLRRLRPAPALAVSATSPAMANVAQSASAVRPAPARAGRAAANSRRRRRTRGLHR
jgi:hypothetical protein